MKISDLFAGENVIRMPYDYDVERATADSRRADARSVFFALRGHHTDGAAYIGDAYARGARVFVTADTADVPKDAAIFSGSNPYDILSKLYGAPDRQMRLVGITGTKGKTTTAAFLAALLRGAGVPTLTVGTGGITGIKAPPTANTTPDLFTLMPLFKRAVAAGIRTAVLEVSSQALADGRVDGLTFDTVIFTSFGRDHIGTTEHPDMESYFAAKRRLFTDFGARTAILNADDPASAKLLPTVGNVIFVGEKGSPKISDTTSDRDGSTFRLDGTFCRIALPGIFNIRNAALALTAAKQVTVLPLGDLAPTLSAVSVPGRFERFERFGRQIVIDYAHNAPSVSALLLSSKTLYSGAFYAVIGSVGDRGEDRRIALAEPLEAYATHTVLTADDPGNEHPLVIAAAMHAAFRDKSRATVIADRAEAVKYAARLSRPGDVIFLLGKGAETAQKTGDRNQPYSDRSTVVSLPRSFFGQ